jgi:hypothetical protein
VDSLVRKIVVDIVTSYASGAGTRGDVFLGLGGREFRLCVDRSADFERGSEASYQLGEDANVRDPQRNDPRQGRPVRVADVLAHPVYVRMAPKGADDDWNIEAINVRVLHEAERRAIRFSALEGPKESIWLGMQSGTTLHLDRSADDRSGYPEA